MIRGRQEPFSLLVSARGVQVIATRVSPAFFGALGTECSIETGATLKIGEPIYGRQKDMPLLTELEMSWPDGFYKDAAPDGTGKHCESGAA